MAPHSSTLAWKLPLTEEPGRLQSMGSRRVEHDWTTSLSLFTFMHWRRKWQPTPVFLPGESQGQGSLVGCRLRGHTRVGHHWSDLAAAAGRITGKSHGQRGTGTWGIDLPVYWMRRVNDDCWEAKQTQLSNIRHILYYIKRGSPYFLTSNLVN